MFTGIVEEQGTIAALGDARGGKRLVVRAEKALEGTRIDDSICVSGVCLTVVGIDAKTVTFDVVPETLRRSTLGNAKVGSRVNLERAMSAAQRFGGHYVQGHVDTTMAVTERTNDGNAINLCFSLPEKYENLVVEKGFVAVDGVSLTVAKNATSSFSTTLVPHTQERVTLGNCIAGDRVNVEFDVFAKYVQRAVDQRVAKLEREVAELRKRLG